jgi:integrase
MLKIEENILPDESENINHLSFSDSSWVITTQHKALTMTLFYTACRVGEICKQNSEDKSLQVEDVYPETNDIELYRLKKKGKGYKRDMTAVPSKLIDCLLDYMERNNIEEGDLFPFTTRTAQNKIKEINEAYQYAFGEFKHMDKLTPHKFRHGRITDIANNTGLEEAGEYVDHASPETTQQYKHVSTEEQREMLPEENNTSDEDKISELMEELGVNTVEEALKQVNSD